MQKRKIVKYSDEEIIQALIEAGTARKAAQIIGCNKLTVQNRMKKPDFHRAFTAAKADLLRETSASLARGCTQAAEILLQIAQNEEINAQTRVNAASAVLQHALKYTETIDIIGRIEALENERKVNNNADREII